VRALCINEKKKLMKITIHTLVEFRFFINHSRVVNRCYMLLHTYNIQSYFPIFQILHIVPETGKKISEMRQHFQNNARFLNHSQK